jgi:nucleoside 2-deoxyribosyltransferase
MALSPSQRVTLIKEIASRLSEEHWPLIDTTLRAFLLPTSDEWNGQAFGYVLQMVDKASDQTLLALAEHVGFQANAPSPLRVDPPFWRKNMLKLFVTHLSAHREYAGQLQEHLLSFGISCFVAHNDIEPTLEWQNEIQTALTTCDGLIALLHPNFHASKWTDQEIGFAMGRGVPVFCVRFGEDPYGFLGRFQAFNGANKESGKLAKDLFDAFRKNKQTQQLMANLIVAMFVESNSFVTAKSNMNLLEELEAWDGSFPAKLRSALKHNTQVSDAFGVPERLEALIKKWS